MKKIKYSEDDAPEDRYALQKVAREQMKLRLLQDILIDLNICKIEGWDIDEYRQELLQLIKEIG